MTVNTVLNGRYELGEEVGRGGMAVTYRARDTLLDRTVAVKVMREPFSSDPDFVERFRREAQAAARLSHPNIAGVYDTGADGDRRYIVMEFVEGENLEQALRRKGPFEPLEAIDIALQVVAALETAHRAGIVHRDVKPHNILINTEGRVKVTDFGLAKAITASSQTETGTIMGSVHYFSPEQARGVTVGPQSDLYSLGIVLFELTTGRRPFEGENPVAVAHKQIYDEPPLPSEYRSDLPHEIENIILKCIEKSLARRYANAAELRGYLENAYQQLVSRPPRMRGGRATARGRRVRRAAIQGALVGLVVIGGAALYLSAVARGQSRLATVPRVMDLDPTSAQRLLADAGLTYQAAPDGMHSETRPGLVARQEPPPDTRVKPQSPVTVWLSLGPQYAKVPDVARMSRVQAERTLRRADLEPGRIIEQYDDNIPAGRVVASEPAAGSQADWRSRVALILSRGKPPAAPEVAGAGEGPAQATIAYTVPKDAGSGRFHVRVAASDQSGTRILYDASHMAGDELPALKVRYKGRMVVHVFIDGRETWSQAFGSEQPPAGEAPSEPPPSSEPAPAGE